jgi:hypothetical protein
MTTTARVIDAGGHVTEPADLWETYPHVNAKLGVVRKLRARIARLPETSRRKILGGKAGAPLRARVSAEMP